MKIKLMEKHQKENNGELKMKSAVINQVNPKTSLVMGLYWINKKAVVNEGCAPFLIEKISTETTTYISSENKFLKLSYAVMKDILRNIDDQKLVEFKIKIGNEDINAAINKNDFFISTSRSKELEDEIIEKIEQESKKKFPAVCSKFYRRLGIT